MGVARVFIIQNPCARLDPFTFRIASYIARHYSNPRVVANPFDLPGVRQRVDVKHTALFREPNRCYDPGSVLAEGFKVYVFLAVKLISTRRVHLVLLACSGAIRLPVSRSNTALRRNWSVLHGGPP